MSEIIIPKNTKKIIIAKPKKDSNNKENDIKEQKQFYCSLFNTNELDDTIYKDIYNTYLFKINNFLIVDIDGENALLYVNNLLDKYNFTIDDIQITKSISNVNKINNYKYHLYFKNNLNIKNNRSIGDLEMLVNKLLFENKKQFDKNIKLDELPDINEDFYNDLLKYKPSIKNDIPQGPEEPKEEPKEKKVKKIKNKDFDYKDDNNIIEEINEEMIISLLSILSNNRASEYNDWFKIGQILYNINSDFLDIFDNFSKRSGNLYNKREVNLKWNEYFKNSNSNKENKATMATIIYMAKEDNINEFKKWFNMYKKKNIEFDEYYYNSSCYPNIDKSQLILNYIIYELKGIIKDHDYARIFKILYDCFIYSNENLYYFNKIIWKKQSKINGDLIKYVSINLFKYLNETIENEITKNKLMDKYNQEKINYLLSIKEQLNNLKDNSKRKGILTSILVEIENNNIIFDSYYPNYIAFNNCIFDLKNKEFIEPKPEYYMSMSTGYNYNFYTNSIDRTKEETRKKEILNLLEKIFPNKEIRDYYLMLLSQGLGGNLIELFIICTGSGGNGKSLLHEFFKSMMGEYAYSLPNQVLSQTLQNTGGPNPVLANMHLKRFILASEPDADKRLKSSTIKELTGNTEYNARTCHETNTNKLLAMTLFLECNDKPLVDKVDGGLARRLRIINFNSKFINEDEYIQIINEIDNCNDLKQEEKDNYKNKYGIINRNYKTKEFKLEYRQSLFNILIDYYNKYDKTNETIPNEIKENAKIYLELSGDIIPFINDNYYKPDDYLTKKTEKEKYKISLVELFNKFKLNDLYINMTKEAKRDFNKSKFSELIEKYYPIDFRSDKPGPKGTKYLYNYLEIIKQSNIKSDFDIDFED